MSIAIKYIKMRKIVLILTLFLSVISAAQAQTAVDYCVNNGCGLSDSNGKKDIVVYFPGKSAHQIYTLMATNIGVLYNDPGEVMYGVDDAFIAVRGHSDDLCTTGSQKWSANYTLRFVIKDEKVLILNPSITLKSKDYSLKKTVGREIDFVDFINQYWYDNNTGQFISSESQNMRSCELEISGIVNYILGILPSNTIPTNW